MRDEKGQFMKGHQKLKNAYSFVVGHKFSQKAKEKISNSHKGLKHTEALNIIKF
jgi:hypothetical protein